MPTAIATTVFRAGRSYAARMLAAHALSYPLAIAAGWVAWAHLAPAGAARAARGAAGAGTERLVGALAVVTAAFVLTNLLAHRWALSAAWLRVARDGEWVRWVVSRLLERASGDDRRGTRAVKRVVEMLGSGGAVGAVGRFALDRVGFSMVGRVAEVLRNVPNGPEPIATRVQRAVEARLAGERRARATVLAVAALAIAGATTVAALR